MKFLATLVFCAVVFSARAELIQFWGRSDTMDYSPNTAVVSKCYDITCPSGTSACSRVKKTSKDLETVTTTYKCENENGEVLHSESEVIENPYPGVQIQSFSYSGVYHSSSNVPSVQDNNDSYNYDRNRYNGGNDLDSQVETFST